MTRLQHTHQSRHSGQQQAFSILTFPNIHLPAFVSGPLSDIRVNYSTSDTHQVQLQLEHQDHAYAKSTRLSQPPLDLRPAARRQGKDIALLHFLPESRDLSKSLPVVVCNVIFWERRGARQDAVPYW